MSWKSTVLPNFTLSIGFRAAYFANSEKERQKQPFLLLLGSLRLPKQQSLMQKNVKFCSINTVNVQWRDDFWLFALSQVHTKKPPKRGFFSYIKHKLIYGYFLILYGIRLFYGCLWEALHRLLNHTSHTSLKIQPKFKLLYFSFFTLFGKCVFFRYLFCVFCTFRFGGGK